MDSGVSAILALKVDAGATAALKDGSSLLPAGVLEVSGSFQRGDAITILDEKGIEIGRGLAPTLMQMPQKLRVTKQMKLQVC